MGNMSFSDILVIAAAVIALILLMRRSGASHSHRYARIPVRTDDRYHGQTQTPEPAEEEIDPAAWMEWFLFASLLLVIAMILGKV